MFLSSSTCVSKIKVYLKMKIATHNSNLKSFIGKEIHSTFKFMHGNDVKLSEKRDTKGMVKSFLGIVYFAALMYSLFVLFI